VLDPEGEQSLEVSSAAGQSTSLTYDPNLRGRPELSLSRDRITVIDCGGTCGHTAPSASVALPTAYNSTPMEPWNTFWPVNVFSDLAHWDRENPEGMELVPGTRRDYEYVERVGRYCGENNLNLSEIELEWNGVVVTLEAHQCYSKCSLNAPCTGGECFCDGHFSGFDGPTSNALCAGATMLRELCNRLPECRSYEMHATLNRGFLNGVGCEGNDELLNATHTEHPYNLYIKKDDFVDQGLQEQDPGGPVHVIARRLNRYTATTGATARGWPFSWSQLLRWRGVQFLTGGRYKLCFCDSEHLGEDGACRENSHYDIEIGSVHVSGVSCMISNPRFHRANCVAQYYGGLRCYTDGLTAPLLSPPVLQPVTPEGSGPGGDMEVVEQLTAILETYCAFGPSEITASDWMANDPRCQLVSDYQSTYSGKEQTETGTGASG